MMDLCMRVTPGLCLTFCCQHSSLLGPFSDEWKHVSQVKDIMYFLLWSPTLCHTFVIVCLFFVLFVCWFVWDRHKPKKLPQRLASALKSSRTPGKNSIWTVLFLLIMGKNWTNCKFCFLVFFLSVPYMQLVLYSVWHVRAEQIQKSMAALLQV